MMRTPSRDIDSVGDANLFDAGKRLGEPTGDPSREAIAALRGYAYQLYASALAWLRLTEGETLYLEVALCPRASNLPPRAGWAVTDGGQSASTCHLGPPGAQRSANRGSNLGIGCPHARTLAAAGESAATIS